MFNPFEHLDRSGQSRLRGQECIVQIDIVHPFKLHSTQMSSVELQLPRFSWHIITGRVLGPHAVFSSRLVIALILVTQLLG